MWILDRSTCCFLHKLFVHLFRLFLHTYSKQKRMQYLSPPFACRDADVEIQTDGFDDTSYGRMGSVNDRTMGWGGGGLYMTLFS